MSNILRRLRIFVRNLFGIAPHPMDLDNDGHWGGSRKHGK